MIKNYKCFSDRGGKGQGFSQNLGQDMDRPQTGNGHDEGHLLIPGMPRLTGQCVLACIGVTWRRRYPSYQRTFHVWKCQFICCTPTLNRRRGHAYIMQVVLNYGLI